MVSLPISERDNHAFSYMAETENGVFEISHWAKTCIKAHAILHKCYFHLALLRHFERMLSLSSGKCCNRLDHKRCRKEGWGGGGKTAQRPHPHRPLVFGQTATSQATALHSGDVWSGPTGVFRFSFQSYCVYFIYAPPATLQKQKT